MSNFNPANQNTNKVGDNVRNLMTRRFLGQSSLIDLSLMRPSFVGRNASLYSVLCNSFSSIVSKYFRLLCLSLFLIFSNPLEAQVSFSQSNLDLNGQGSINNGTSIMFGPDGRLYVLSLNGNVDIFTVQKNGANDYVAIDGEELTAAANHPNHNDDGSNAGGGRQATGLTVAGTATNPVVYVTHSDSRIGGPSGDKNLDTNSGVITRFYWNGSSWDVVDIVRGLPRSEENHSTNGLEFVTVNGNDYLIVCSGGFTNAGAPSDNFAWITEYTLSGAILSVDLTALEALPIQTDAGSGRSYIYDIPTLDDPTRPNVNGITDPDDPGYDGIDVGDPWGGNDGLNQGMLVIGEPVQMFSPGYRNTYDLAIGPDGKVYATDNGANGGWGGLPINEGDPALVNNSYDPSEPGSTSSNPTADGESVNNADHLHKITDDISTYDFGSYYGGHPCPVRANPTGAGLFTNPGINGENTLSGQVFRTQIYDPDGSTPGSTIDPNLGLPANWPPVPPSLANPDEADWRGPGINNPDGPNDDIITTWGTNTNALDVYTSSAFGGAMQGDLIAGKNGGVLRRVDYDPQDDTYTLISTFASGLGGNCLGVTCNSDFDPFPGTIWVAPFNGSVVILEPDNFVLNCFNSSEPEYDGTEDYDSDGYTNDDELDNKDADQTDEEVICNGGSQPNDFDKDAGGILVSDLNDPDDDNDGIDDANDPFQLGDPLDSGSDAFTLPVLNELFSDNPDLKGYLGLGFTGLMNNGDPNPNWLNWLDRRDDPADPNPNDILGGAIGAMTMQMTSGTALGNANSQEKAFQYGVQVDQSTGSFSIEGAIQNFTDNYQLYHPSSPSTGEIGIFMGDGTQSNYIKFVLNQSGLQVLQEIGDVPETPIDVAIPTGDRPTNAVKFRFSVDPVSGQISAEYQLDEDGFQNAGTLTAQGSILSAIQNANEDLAVGLIGSSNSSGQEVEGTWDYLFVQSSVPAVEQEIPDVDALINDPDVLFELDQYFTDDGGDENLTFTVENNTDPTIGASIVNNTLTITIPGAAATADITVRATDEGSSFAEQTFTVTVSDEPVPILRIRANGAAITAMDAPNPDWIATGGTGQQSGTFNGINWSVNTGNLSTHNISGRDASVPDYVPQSLFAIERWDPAGTAPDMEWTFDLPDGNYLVRLYCGNGFSGTSQPGQRVFDILIEEQIVTNDLDLSAQFGHQVGVMLEYSVQLTDGTLNVGFGPEVENPTMNGIEILQIGGDFKPPILVEDIPDQNNQEGDEAITITVLPSGGVPNENYQFSAEGLPPGIQIEPTTGLIFGDIADGAAANSPYNVTITVDQPSNEPTDETFVWTITQGPSPAEALVEVIPGGNNINASTFSNGSFAITNNSPSASGINITSITFDMSTGFLPNMVFDPDGTAGDQTAKDFQIDQGVGGNVTDAFSQPLGNGGFQQLDVTFDDFAPGETFTFSVDQDPTSIEGLQAPGPDESGSVSGLEQVGSTVTVTFSDGSSYTTNLYSDGSNAGATSVARDALPTAPVLSAIGLPSPSTTNMASQNLQITGGPANGTVSLLQVEGAFFEDGGDLGQEPYEVNSAISVDRMINISLDANGEATIPVTLTDSDPKGGYNYFIAAVEDGSEFGLTSNTVILEYDSEFLPPEPGVLFRVNAGGPSLSASDAPNPDWEEDTGNIDNDGNSQYLVSVSPNTSTYTQAAVSAYKGPIDLSDPSLVGTNVPADVFTTERYDGSAVAPPMVYEFPVASGTYEVRLYLMELFSGIDAAGERVFDVSVEGTVPPVFDDIDAFARNGALGAFMLAHQVFVTDGALTIEFTHGVENPAVKAIEILGSAPGTTPSVADADVINEAINGNQTGVDVVLATTSLLDLSNGLNDATVNTSNIQLLQGGLPVTGVSVNPTADGSNMVLSANDLDFGTEYTFQVSSGVQDGDGNAFSPFSFSFTTDAGGSVPSPNVAFDESTVDDNVSYTNLEIGPDGKLYGLANNGVIHRFDINPDGTLANEQVITSLTTAESGDRLALGMAFDPSATAQNLILWVTHSDFAFSGAAANSGKLSQLSGANLENVTTYIEGLPRAENAHATNEIAFDSNGDLYISQGHTAGAGEPGATDYGSQGELPLSAAILSVDISAIIPPYDAATADGETGPVVPYATGVRNAYGMTWHSNGNLYAPVNGPETGNPVPAANGNPSFNLTVDPLDYLLRVEQGGYYGHPNPGRGELILNGGNPTAGSDPAEVTEYPVGTLPDPNYRSFAYKFGESEAPGGIIEYQSAAFNGALQGKLLVVRYNQGNDIVALTPGGSNQDIIGAETIYGGFINPLAIVENPATGDLYVSEYTGNLKLLKVAATPNADPIVTNPGNQLGFNGQVINLPISATDADNCGGLTYSATGLPPGLDIDENLGVISGTIDPGSGGTGGAFIEQNGLVVIEMESADNLPNNWETISDYSTTFSPNVNNPTEATGGDFIIWQASQSLNTPGNGLITYQVQITNPGTYQFKWRNQVGNGTNTTEHNDTWLKIEADAFYGSKDNGNSIVCPNGALPSNDCSSTTNLNGSSSSGWFKIYSSGANNWSWSTNTSDNDAHQIFARFDAEGTYNILVSARSSSHVIDRMVLVNESLAGNNGQNTSLAESPRTTSGMAAASENSPYNVTVTVEDNCDPAGSTDVSFDWVVTSEPQGNFPSALVQVNPGAGIGASTFGNNSFQITNTGDVDITNVTINSSTSFLPDVVFDPVGTAGDNGAKCLTEGSASVGDVGITVPADGGSDEEDCESVFAQPHNGVDNAEGYDVITLVFEDFNPNEKFAFGVDMDPTSIKGDLSTGDAGSISGFELIGSTVTITFADGTTLQSSLWDEGSLGGSQAVVAQNAPTPAPTISALGIGAGPAVVSDLNQTIIITGPAGANVTLLQVDGRLYIDPGNPTVGYDVDPFEANEAVDKALYTATLDANGMASIPVTLLQTAGSNGAPDGGINHFIAVVDGVGDQTSMTSNTIVLEYDPNAQLAALTITANLQGRSDHSGTYTVDLYQVGAATPSYQFTPTANVDGEMTLTNLDLGEYEVAVKFPNSLKVVETVTLAAGSNAVNVGTLPSGDANNDNLVTGLDFSILASTFNLAAGDPDYDGRADFNGDESVTGLDFSLFASNFNTGGEEPSGSALVSGTFNALPKSEPAKVVDLVLESKNGTIAYGETFSVLLKAKAGAQAIDVVEAHLAFDPEMLAVESITWANALETQLREDFNNETGELHLAAGSLYDTPSLDIAIAWITFRAIGKGETAVQFVNQNGWSQEVAYKGYSVLDQAIDHTLMLEATTTNVDDVKVQSVNLNIYPNPSKGRITIDLDDLDMNTTSRIRIYNGIGQIVFDNKFTGVIHEIIDLSKHGRGVYSVQVTSDAITTTQSVILQ